MYQFFEKNKKIKPYIVEFNEDGIIKSKMYPSNYIVNDEECWPIIVITHDECIFSAKNGI